MLPDGTLDFSWPQPDSSVVRLALDASGRVLAVGNFAKIGATDRRVVARYAADGTFDATFAPAFTTSSLTINGFALDPSGNLLLGGSLGSISGQPGPFSLIRISAAGVHDTAFNTAAYNALFTNTVNALLPLADGTILVSPGSVGLRRLLATGALDNTFSHTSTVGVIRTHE